MKHRISGILLHITSLPSKEGIGTLGVHAMKWIDFLKQSRQTVWQILPLGPVGYAHSPYLCYSAFAGNPLLIDLESLLKEGLIQETHLKGTPRFDIRQVEFDRIEKWKAPLLRKAFQQFRAAKNQFANDYHRFLDENGWWVNDYSLFMSAKFHFGGISWQGWPDELKFRTPEGMEKYRIKLADEIEYRLFEQFIFFRQWSQIHDYAKKQGIRIFGDMPLYVAGDSADVWANTEIFMLDEKLEPTHIGGVPPDYFSETGQLWGNPVYDWDALKKQNYHWWMARIHFNLRMFDLVRIDHFRGLESFWAIPAGSENAISGEWLPAYGHEMLSLLKSQIGDLPLIAEDLGIITPEVDKLRASFNLPGMKVLQFAFTTGPDNDYLPHNYDRNYLVYTGTHDNDTSWAWLHAAGKEEKRRALDYLKPFNRKPVDALIEMAWASVAYMAFIPLQDLLGLGAEARMNIPGLASGNWGWRFRWDQIRGRHQKFLVEINQKYNRNGVFGKEAG
ncbi:4-alpha-glucanotransferase [Bacteroidales bacterium 6E]|nr:4-alpha-glucanotransferase [Bacteroidales bacterium 6E]